MIEEWKDIEDYPNYQVSNLGRVRSLKYEKVKILKPSKYNGYSKIGLTKNNKTYTQKVHILVAKAFIPNPENKPEIDHINTDRTDNRVCNLRWVTHKENMNNPITIEKNRDRNIGENNPNFGKTGKQSPRFGIFGKLHPNSKPILQFTKDEEFIQKWNSGMDIQRELGIYSTSISRVCKGKNKTCGGYKWGYAEDYERIPFKVFDLEIYRKKVA